MIDEDKLNALELFGENEYLHKEIERLKNIIDKNKYTADELNEIERLNNIIKEVREYIEEVETLAMVDKVNIFSMSILKMILDKENK